MALSQRTIDEMKAGMTQVAKNGGVGELEPGYMDAMIRTGIRAKWLRDREKEGKLRIERVLRRHTNVRHDYEGRAPEYTTFVVHVGKELFTDDNACLTGCWPSEVLLAQVALALGAGVGESGEESCNG